MRILIVDDHPVVRKGIRGILAESDSVCEIGETALPQQAIDAVRASEWDGVLLDLGLPGRGGLDLLRDLKHEFPKLPVLVLSMQPEEQYAVRALRAGASGYLTKTMATDHLLDAIKKVVGGGRYVSPAVADQLVGELGADADRPKHASLSDREFEVMKLLASGITVGAVANKLALSVKTVSTYRARILEKMRLSTNADLTRYALSHNLID